MKKEIIKAIENLNVIEFDYEGEIRVVEPHCYGQTTAGNVYITEKVVTPFRGKVATPLAAMGSSEWLDSLTKYK